MKIFGMGMPEFFVILLVVVLLFGWKLFPKLGASVGRFIGNFKHEVDDDDPWGDKVATSSNVSSAPQPQLTAPKPKPQP